MNTKHFTFESWFSVRFCQQRGLEEHCGRAENEAFPVRFALLPSAAQLLAASGWSSGFYFQLYSPALGRRLPAHQLQSIGTPVGSFQWTSFTPWHPHELQQTLPLDLLQLRSGPQHPVKFSAIQQAAVGPSPMRSKSQPQE